MRNTYAGLVENPNEQFLDKESTKKNFNQIPQNMRLANTIHVQPNRNFREEGPPLNQGREEFNRREPNRNFREEAPLHQGREEFTKRGDLSKMLKPNKEGTGEFYFNNKNNANVTGSYVRSGGNKNEEYMRKTYNYYGDYRDKLNVFIFI